MNQEVMNLFSPQAQGPDLRPDSRIHRESGENPVLVLWRDQKA